MWWRVSQISGARARYLGEVEAAGAIAKAFEKFDVQPAHYNRLIAQPSE